MFNTTIIKSELTPHEKKIRTRHVLRECRSPRAVESRQKLMWNKVPLSQVENRQGIRLSKWDRETQKLARALRR